MTKDNRKLTNFDDFLVNELKDPSSAEEYLKVLLESFKKDQNIEALLHCLKPLIEAQGSISEFARKTNIDRSHLYKIFNNEVEPKFNTMANILNNLGYEIDIKPRKKKKLKPKTSKA